MGSSKNYVVIRYADVLLWKAEALIELGRQDEALPIINQIRERAKNSMDALKWPNGDYFSKYNIELYVPGENCTWDQDFAREALRWERKLEFAMEGKRFFDLIRWGIAEEKLNQHFAKEQTYFSWLANGHFTSGRDEYLPIPVDEITLSKGVYIQNPGY
jgi:hypothetical protein